MDNFAFPDRLDSLVDVPADLQPSYEADGAGGFRLTPEASDMLKEHEREMERLEAEHTEAMAARAARIVVQDGLIKALLTSMALAEAMEACGVPARLRRGAAALLASSLTIEVDESSVSGQGHVLVVKDGFGLISVEGAVQRWLDSSAGQPFRPTAPLPGPFAKMIAEMSAPR